MVNYIFNYLDAKACICNLAQDPPTEGLGLIQTFKYSEVTDGKFRPPVGSVVSIQYTGTTSKPDILRPGEPGYTPYRLSGDCYLISKESKMDVFTVLFTILQY